MTSPAEAAKNTVELGKKHVLDQEIRIFRQCALIAKLERDGHPDVLADAHRLLAQMEQSLATMQAHCADAQERLLEASVDEPSLPKVERDKPM